MNLFIWDNVSSQIYKSLTSKSSLFWTIYLPSFLLTFSISLLIPILPSFIKELGVGVGLVGLGISAVLIGNMFFVFNELTVELTTDSSYLGQGAGRRVITRGKSEKTIRSKNIKKP